MTSPRTRRRSGTERDPRDTGHLAVGAALVAGLTIVLAGCGGEEPEATVVKRSAPARSATPPPPPPPKLTPVDQLMARLSIDERVALAESEAPDNDPDRIALLEFFDGFARGDEETLGTMLSALDRDELMTLADEPAWKDSISKIAEIQIMETGRSPDQDKCALAIFDVEGDFQPQLWYYEGDGESYRFEAVATPPGIMDKLYGDDWIAAWHALLEEEMMLANQVEIEVEPPSVVVGESSSGGSRSAGGAPPSRPPNVPGATPGGPGRKPDRRPPGKKRKPPGAR